MAQKKGMINPNLPHHVCRLRKAFYSLKHAPQAWYNELKKFLLSLTFFISRIDTSLFILIQNHSDIYFLVYVDYLIITGSEPSLIEYIFQELNCKFSIKDLSALSYFCGVEALPTSIGLLLTKKKYVVDQLLKHNMLNSKPVIATPLSVCFPPCPHTMALP